MNLRALWCWLRRKHKFGRAQHIVIDGDSVEQARARAAIKRCRVCGAVREVKRRRAK